jgi:hypothetical protein
MSVKSPTFARPEVSGGTNMGTPEQKLLQKHGQTPAARMAGALHTDRAGYTLSVGRKIKMEIPADSAKSR